MKTEAYFNNIKQVLVSELLKANSSILVAVAWFTDGDLFSLLCSKAKNKVNVELIIADDEINKNCNLNYEHLNQVGGRFSYHTRIDNKSLMHNKFCIIDLKTAITGSYNWSYQARHNRENITVSQDVELALQFAKYFYTLKYGSHFNISELSEKEHFNLIYYLHTIKKRIESTDFENINSYIFLLRNLKYGNDDIFIIFKLLENCQWTQALNLINTYLKLHQQLSVYEDFELSALSFHKKSLEAKLDQLILLKDDLERRIHHFAIEYNQKLGDLIIELIELKRQYNLDYSESFIEDKQKVYDDRNTDIKDLSENDNQELKKVYKKAALLCHPDKVDESMKTEAEEIFKRLNTAYKNNDIEEVTRIFSNLSSNNFLIREKSYDSKSSLKKEIERLVYLIDQIKFEIEKIWLTQHYILLDKVHDWNLFYKLEREKIFNEIKEIKNEFSKKTIFKKNPRRKSTKNSG